MMHYLLTKACPVQINHQINLNPMNWNPHHLFQHRLMLELKFEEIRQLLHIPNIPLPPSIDWPPIEMSPINEYNTKGLLSIAFPTLFPQVQQCYYNHAFIKLICMNMHFTLFAIMTIDFPNILSFDTTYTI